MRNKDFDGMTFPQSGLFRSTFWALVSSAKEHLGDSLASYIVYLMSTCFYPIVEVAILVKIDL